MIGTDPNAKGGIATVVDKYRRRGLFDKWNVIYLTTHMQGSVAKKLLTALGSYRRMIGLLLVGRVNLIHIHVASRASTWRKAVFAFTAFVFRVPYVLHLHGGGFADFYYKECGPLRRYAVRILFEKASSVIALSRSWAAKLHEMVPTAHIDIIYNSVSLPAQQNQCEQGECKKILFLGQITKEKGVFDLIRAIAIMGEDAELVLGGDGESDMAAELARELDISGRVRLPGWVLGEDKEKLLSTASIFILPSYKEGLPVSVLEAMAWGIPVVATPVGGIPEVVRHGKEGLIIQPGDINEMSSVLRTLLDDAELRQRLGTNGRERVRRIFSDDVELPKFEALWTRFGLIPLCREKVDRN
jgi:glycosyltransferase involved in cell wall biosynthesis